MDIDIYRALTKTGVADQDARQVVVALDHDIDQRIALRQSHFATKGDVAELRAELTTGLAAVTSQGGQTRSELKAEIATVRSELKVEIGELRTELRTEFSELRGETGTEVAGLGRELRNELAELRGEMKTEFASVRTELADFRSDVSQRFSEVHQRFGSLEFATVQGLSRLEASTAQRFADMQRWLIATLFGAAALMAALLKLMP